MTVRHRFLRTTLFADTVTSLLKRLSVPGMLARVIAMTALNVLQTGQFELFKANDFYSTQFR